MRKQNIRHGRARHHPIPAGWFVLAGVLLAVVVALPFIHVIFGKL